MMRNMNQQMLWLFNVIKEAEQSIIKFDNRNFVEDNIRRIKMINNNPNLSL
jgi:hypothetical protein